MDDALITGIKAILAEEYSRELSKRINNAHRNRQKDGKSFVLTRNTYGLKKLPDKRIVIDEAEAEMIRKIIRNPIYTGTVVQNRQHYDFESKRIFKNPPSEWVIHEHVLPAHNYRKRNSFISYCFECGILLKYINEKSGLASLWRRICRRLL